MIFAQIALLIGWFTVLPTLPALVVFIPLMVIAVRLVVLFVILGLAAVAIAFSKD
jgi:hypothetical protein